MIERAVVVGAGLIGTSIALALRERGVEVALADRDPATVRLACELGAGVPLEEGKDERPADIAVVAAPPAVIPALLRDVQSRGLARFYTDVASVKQAVVTEAVRLGCDLTTFVPSHPMGGSERNGPSAARADLFLGRSWALCPTGKATPEAVAAVAELARSCGADPLEIDAQEHDRAVALVSHAPHVASSAVAARLVEGGGAALALAGQGVRDVTRVAGGDPGLWLEILSHNPGPVAEVLAGIAADLDAVARALRSGRTAEATVLDLLERGRDGHARIPGKHGAGRTPGYAVLPVVIPDEPGALGRLFAAAGTAGVNIEDIRIDHSPGLPVGVAQLSVLPERVATLARALADQGWSVHPDRLDRPSREESALLSGPDHTAPPANLGR
ncbi:prephenate dehydrogenase [Marinactinospora thermotolerans]|uniref:Prephenate dehydrogenase n=1 Tax=Marinactinospora thermotolerans DSM 45154 TaxID=1122192 RepID=A0A1T4KNQ0_9ACTN|nr:prephenate dehydrogenase [Marinactinospora thermotolerans]SJZ44031.1 prephenate dehydrogenase [Marinactinospora thermotolerans DSM 45154]